MMQMSILNRSLTPYYRAQLSYPVGKLCRGFIALDQYYPEDSIKHIYLISASTVALACISARSAVDVISLNFCLELSSLLVKV